MIIERAWAMPSRKTFSIKPIGKLINDELGDNFIDPFPYPYKQDALKYLKTFSDNSIDKLVFDPPYSQRQLREVYDSAGLSLDVMNASYWKKLKNEIARIMKKDGKTVSFGWNTVGIGKTRGFEITRILIVSHGGQHNDTLCTVERKIRL